MVNNLETSIDDVISVILKCLYKKNYLEIFSTLVLENQLR